MSGGERKKRGGDKGQGWEEAGAEFYQERYPGVIDADFQQALQRDPSNIATLLPSIQCRVATSKRMRNEPKATLRRRTSTRSRGTTTARRMSTHVPADTTMSMLPDLSENLSNEERTWEEIMQIKAMPVCMAQKIQLKRQLQSATKLRLQGFEQLKWQRRKAWQEFRERMKEAYSKIELWSSSFKEIGGNFGMSVVAYFYFIKWLMFLNILLFIITFMFVILPTIVFKEDLEVCNPLNRSDIACCSEQYRNETGNANFLTNFMKGALYEHTLLFYGQYSYRKFGENGQGLYYNLPLAYLCTTFSIFAVSLFAIVRSAAKGFKERVVEGEGQFYQYCNLIFGGWDFCIHNEKSAVIKHKALHNEIKVLLETEKLQEERQNRTRQEKIKLFLIRVFVNIFVILVLMSCGYFIYYIIDLSFDKVAEYQIKINYLKSADETIKTRIIQIAFEFLPYVCIVFLNIVVPFLFQYLVTLEHYSPLHVVRLSIFRTIFLRLASLGVLLANLNVKVTDDDATLCGVKDNQRLCWESFVGNQFFKLYLTDFFSHVLVTFVINFPRSFLDRHTTHKIFHLIGEQEFILAENVLDIVYSQAICWLGSFFVPMMPLIAIIGYFLMFYIKKFSCLVNSTPSSHVYRASRSNSLFMFVLLISFILVVIPVGYAIVVIKPSKSCGPFRDLDTIWTLVINTFKMLPHWIQSFFEFLGTAGFGVPAFIFLALLLYYYNAVSIANRHMVVVLKNQLILEGHDKQFLLNRLSAFIKQQQEQSKYQDQSIELGNFS